MNKTEKLVGWGYKSPGSEKEGRGRVQRFPEAVTKANEVTLVAYPILMTNL
jgi:hypothetical protein